MARSKLLLAILLALTVLVSPAAQVFADGVTGGPGGTREGHPWDDRTDVHRPSFTTTPARPHAGMGTGTLRVANPPALSMTDSGSRFMYRIIQLIVARW